jgi:hypothetical protein
MRELEALLKQHDNSIEFNHLNNRIRCYPHIVNICSSHIIASSTHISRDFLEGLRSESSGDLVYSNIESDNDNDDNGGDDGNNNNGRCLFSQKANIPKFTLDEGQLAILGDKARALYTGLNRDPIERARRIVRFVRSSDQRKQEFQRAIDAGNRACRFKFDNEVIEVPNLELLCDVKTRWDSVYKMIERLFVLRPVSDNLNTYGSPFSLFYLTCIQAVDYFCSMMADELTEYKLTDPDWELLGAVYTVLAVSVYLNSNSSAARSTRCTGSSYGSANHVN